MRPMTSPIAELERRIRSAISDASIEHISMQAPDRADALEVRQRGRLISILWTPTDALCITEVSDDSVFDDTPDYAGVSVYEALQLVEFLLSNVAFKDVDREV